MGGANCCVKIEEENKIKRKPSFEISKKADKESIFNDVPDIYKSKYNA